MTTHTQKNTIGFECDNCVETFIGAEGHDFQRVWAEAKEEGWQAKRIGETWTHSCPKCAEAAP